MKSVCKAMLDLGPGRPLCGGRGLKSVIQSNPNPNPKSPPVRGAWVEMTFHVAGCKLEMSSPPVRGAWVEITTRGIQAFVDRSPPVRGAWVEIA